MVCTIKMSTFLLLFLNVRVNKEITEVGYHNRLIFANSFSEGAWEGAGMMHALFIVSSTWASTIALWHHQPEAVASIEKRC